jgi:hypothetical protein
MRLLAGLGLRVGGGLAHECLPGTCFVLGLDDLLAIRLAARRSPDVGVVSGYERRSVRLAWGCDAGADGA